MAGAGRLREIQGPVVLSAGHRRLHAHLAGPEHHRHARWLRGQIRRRLQRASGLEGPDERQDLGAHAECRHHLLDELPRSEADRATRRERPAPGDRDVHRFLPAHPDRCGRIRPRSRRRRPLSAAAAGLPGTCAGRLLHISLADLQRVPFLPHRAHAGAQRPGQPGTCRPGRDELVSIPGARWKRIGCR